MTRRDYVLIADVIREQWDHAAELPECNRIRAFLFRLTRRFVATLAADNPRFDPARFWVAATGLEERMHAGDW